MVLLAACAPSAPADYPRTASADDRWGVGVSFPVYESLDPCDDDPSVEKSLITADLPTSRLGIRLNAGSAEIDAVQVANCVDQALSKREGHDSFPRSQPRSSIAINSAFP